MRNLQEKNEKIFKIETTSQRSSRGKLRQFSILRDLENDAKIINFSGVKLQVKKFREQGMKGNILGYPQLHLQSGFEVSTRCAQSNP